MAQDPLTVITRNDEAGVDFILNNFVLPAAFEVVAKGIKFTMIATDGIWTSQAALDIVNGYATLTATEEIALLNFLTNQDLNGNLALIDEMQIYAFTNVADSLRGMKGVANAINNGATHVPQSGYQTDGAATFVNTSLIPSALTNYLQDNSMLGPYIRQSNVSEGAYLYGVSDINPFRARVETEPVNERLRFSFNDATLTNRTVNPRLQNDMFIIGRLDGLGTNSYLNGVQANQATRPSTGVPVIEVFLGCQNNDSTPNLFNDALFSCFVIGANVGFDHASFYNDLLQLLVDITTFSAETLAVFANMPNPDLITNRDKLKISDFVDSQVASGNYALMDEFFWFGQSNSGNARRSFLTGQAGVLVNNPSHSAGVGYTFNGIDQYLDTFTDPSTLTNYALNDALSGVFVNNNPTPVSNRALFGNLTGANFTQIFQTTTTIRTALNSAGLQDVTAIIISGNYNLSRVINTRNELYEDGIIKATTPSVISTAIPSDNIYIGARNNAGVADLFSDSTISSFVIGAAIGFDHTSFNTALKKLVS